MIVVTGATGQAGSEVARALIAQGGDVRAFVRDPARARHKLGRNVELAVGDFADPQSVRAALDGADTLFLSCSDDPRRVGWERNAIDAAAAAGVHRVVRLSTAAAEPGSPVAFWDWHGQVEQHLRVAGIAWTILRPSWYMSNLLTTAPQVAAEGRLYAPAGQARIAMIDPRDVGAAAAAVLSSAGHEGRSYLLTGPGAITFTQVAAELSVATASRIDFIDIPGEAAYQAMTRNGMPGFAAGQIVKTFEQLRQGVAAQVTATVATLTGSSPRDFASFARDHTHMFAPTAATARGEGWTPPAKATVPPAPSDSPKAIKPAALRATTGGTMMTLEANKALIREVFEKVIPAGDPAAMRDLVAPDWIDHDPLPGQPTGVAGAEYVVSTMHGAHPDLRFSIDDLIAEKDRVTIRWTLHGTNTGPMLGRPPTGQAVELAAIVIFRIADGKIAERWAGWKPGRAPRP